MQFTIAKTQEELQLALAELARERRTIALVPTMGALHAGHLYLVERAREAADAVVMTIFINPFQFNDEKDYNAYPRTLDTDADMAREAGVDIVYAPDREDMYPPEYSTLVAMGGMAEILEGSARPGHFNGVCTVLTKLFMRVLPNIVVFGEKDYQQLMVVSRLINDLDLAIEVMSVPTMRERDGLALSSRNARLNEKERAQAPKLYEVLQEVGKTLEAKKGVETMPILKQTYQKLLDNGFLRVDYIAVCDEYTFEPLANFDRPARLLVAAWLGETRLIDNIAVTPAE